MQADVSLALTGAPLKGDAIMDTREGIQGITIMAIKELLPTEFAQICNEVAEFFASSPTAEQITDFRLSDESEHFVSDLLEANRTRGLTPDEQAVLDEYTRVERMVQAIKVRAYARLRQMGA